MKIRLLILINLAFAFHAQGENATRNLSLPTSDGNAAPAQAAGEAPDLVESFSVDSFPVGLAFDGDDIWVTSDVPLGKVTKLRANDGVNLGSFDAGGSTLYAAFDGTNVWFTNPDNNTVTRLRASDGTPQGTFSVGARPTGILFDDANIWVANEFDNTVSKLQASDGRLLGTFRTGTSPFELAYDGANVWITNLDSGNVTKLRASDGTLQGEFRVGGRYPKGICSDGENIWVTTTRRVAKLRASDGTVIATGHIGEFANDLAFDGVHIWATRSGDGFHTTDALIELNQSDASIENVYRTEEHPVGILFAGASIWVTNYFSATVVKYSGIQIGPDLHTLTLSNLADGGVVNVNGTNLQANYRGGDGNDLTLTVVP